MQTNNTNSLVVVAKALGFSLVLTLLFTLVANTLPQVEGEAPTDTKVSLHKLTMESFITLGKEIFSKKGTCALCHNNLGRAPDLLALNITNTSNQRIKDPNYKGEANTVEQYLRESMINPGIHVVKGYGKKGTQDKISPMPAAHKAPIELSKVEIDAVIAFLQAKDGGKVTVSLPKTTTLKQKPGQAKPKVKEATTAQAVVKKYSCQACHTVFSTKSSVGPSLENIGLKYTREQIRESILKPNAIIVKDYAPIMPKDFADKMTIRELEILLDFLSNKKEKTTK